MAEPGYRFASSIFGLVVQLCSPQLAWARMKTAGTEFNSKLMKKFAEAGTLLPSDMVLKGGTEKWVVANTVTGLFPQLGIQSKLPKTKLETDFDLPVNLPKLPKTKLEMDFELPAKLPATMFTRIMQQWHNGGKPIRIALIGGIGPFLLDIREK